MSVAIAEHYLAAQRAAAGALPGRQLGWLQAQREAALARFGETGFPTRKDEDWRYTNLRPLTGQPFDAAGETTPEIDSRQLDRLLIDGLESHRLVFVNGRYAAALSAAEGLPEGARLTSLAGMLAEQPERLESTLGSLLPARTNGLTALNSAFSGDGAVLELAAGCRLEQPVELLFIAAGDAVLGQPRSLLLAGEGSRATVIERHVSLADEKTLTNSVVEILLERGAELDYYALQEQSTQAFHIGGAWVRQQVDSRFSSRSITLGGALTRNELRAELAGSGAHCDMLGLYVVSGRQHVDNHTTIVHDAEGCTSRESYKGILDQRARAVFHGRIVVRPGAQKTDSEQQNQNLLLSRDAEVDTKPQLEIYADDVKCSHGATVGQLDPGSLFYLRSRGIDEEGARTLLTYAFASDILGEIEVPALRHRLEAELARQVMQVEPPKELDV
ncbi:MAG: Fe-S cluster assembly protein SufD [Pseudomonadota bacterium]|nr:Fe-S cluster assembly protein SufD [Pseudomonadota bacterium]